MRGVPRDHLPQPVHPSAGSAEKSPWVVSIIAGRNVSSEPASKDSARGVALHMRRSLANLMLAAILSTVALPLAVALQSSQIPACCLPSGKHRCRQNPTGPGFNNKNDECPYASLVVATEVKAVRAAKFDLAALMVVGYFSLASIQPGCRIAPGQLSARGPPISVL
jgi:hypothetical protein